MMMTEREDTPADRRLPYYIALFLFVFVSLDGFMAYLAVSTHPGVLVEGAYETGLKYNEVLAAADAQEKKGLVGDIVAVPISSSQVKITLTLKGKGGTPVRGMKGTARLIRLVQSGEDQKGDLVEEHAGVYTALLPLPLKGMWTVEINGHGKNSGDYTLSKSVKIP